MGHVRERPRTSLNIASTGVQEATRTGIGTAKIHSLYRVDLTCIISTHQNADQSSPRCFQHLHRVLSADKRLAFTHQGFQQAPPSFAVS